MFGTLLGPLPRPPSPRSATDGPVVRVIRAQEDAGLEPVTDGAVGEAGDPVGAWTTAAAVASVGVKQPLLGPWSASGGAAPDALAEAERLAETIAGLAAAGCPLVEIHEPALVTLDGDADRRAFVAAHRRLLDALPTIHASLVVTGGDATRARAATLFDLPYASYGFDVRGGPGNWALIAEAPTERGIVVGALAAGPDTDDGPELLVWAAHYAASTRGRGLDRVGLATAGSLAALPWAAAEEKLRRLGEAVRIAAHRTFAEVAPHLDPRAAGTRSAAAGRWVPPRRRRGGSG